MIEKQTQYWTQTYSLYSETNKIAHHQKPPKLGKNTILHQNLNFCCQNSFKKAKGASFGGKNARIRHELGRDAAVIAGFSPSWYNNQSVFSQTKPTVSIPLPTVRRRVYGAAGRSLGPQQAVVVGTERTYLPAAAAMREGATPSVADLHSNSTATDVHFAVGFTTTNWTFCRGN